MANAQAELTKIAEKIMEPPKDSGVGEQLKSLGLTTEERFKVLMKFSKNPTFKELLEYIYMLGVANMDQELVLDK